MSVTRVSTCALALCLAIAATPAWAQEAPPAPETEGLQEIVVTAQRRSESLQDVPIAISVFSAEAITEQGVGNLASLSRLTPNVNLDGGTLITFMVLVMRLLQPLKQLSQAPTTAQQSLAAAERLFDVLDQPTELQADRGTRDVRALERDLAFDGVHFAYGDGEVEALQAFGWGGHVEVIDRRPGVEILHLEEGVTRLRRRL